MRIGRRTVALLIVTALVAMLGGDTLAGKGGGKGKPGGGDPAPPRHDLLLGWQHRA